MFRVYLTLNVEFRSLKLVRLYTEYRVKKNGYQGVHNMLNAKQLC